MYHPFYLATNNMRWNVSIKTNFSGIGRLTNNRPIFMYEHEFFLKTIDRFTTLITRAPYTSRTRTGLERFVYVTIYFQFWLQMSGMNALY